MDSILKKVKFKLDVKDPTHLDVNKSYVESIKVASWYSLLHIATYSYSSGNNTTFQA
jgi:hypothetical protein